MARIPDKFIDLFTTKKTFAQLATVMTDGSPQVTPVWFDHDNGRIRVNTARGRVKDRNMRKHGRVALVVMDPQNPYRHIQVRGHVVDIAEEGADQHIDMLAKKYLGRDTYPNRIPSERRVIYTIEPDTFSTMG